MPKFITIKKLSNDNVEIVHSNERKDYTIGPGCDVFLSLDGLGVDVINLRGDVYKFREEDVTQVIRQDTTVVAIADVATLYSELRDFFFS